MKNYLIGVTMLDDSGQPNGTHHVSSTAAESVEKAKAWAINDTASDWGYSDEEAEGLHVLFVMSTPVGVDISVEEYDEGNIS